jgi:iron complex transport system substrate-binding protein
MSRTPFALIIILLFTGCGNKNPAGKAYNDYKFCPDSLKVISARGFTLESDRKTIRLTVKDPWQNASDITFNYLLSDTFKTTEIINEYNCRIKTPVSNVVCLSTTHIGFLGFISEIRSISGISGKEYVVNQMLRSRISEGTVADVGYDENLNYEVLLKLRPDIVFAYGIGPAITKTIRKLHELGIPVIMIGEYLEEDPLAKMEWVKVFAALCGKSSVASQKFDSVALHYHNLVSMAENTDYKPKVVTGLPYRGTWYVSGSQSYIAQLIKDAGGAYLWNHLNFNESRPMSLEKLFEQALMADYWINPGEALSKRDIMLNDERFSQLISYKNDRVFNNNNVLAETGGNDFYELGVVEPDIILSDLIYILHPQLLPSYSLKFYRKLQ